MKLAKVKIHNYRGIIDSELSCLPYTLLVGANNAGKSTIINAIRAFYEKDGFKYNHANDFPFSNAQDKESWIELTFLLTEDENTSLKEEYQSGEHLLKVRKFFETELTLSDGKPAKDKIVAVKENGTLFKEPFYGAKNVQSGKFGNLIYIPAISKVDEQTKLTGPSALRELLTSLMKGVVEESEAYGNLKKNITEFASKLTDIESNDKHSLSSFESDLNKELAPWGAKFELTIPAPSMDEIIKSMLRCEINDAHHNGYGQKIDSFGSGFQRHLIYSLIKLNAQYQAPKTSSKPKDFTPTLNLLLFEEPEAFLHPPQQDDLARNLIDIAGRTDWQVICTTHSAHFVSRDASELPSIVRVSRTDTGTTTSQISQKTWEELLSRNTIFERFSEEFPTVCKKFDDPELQREQDAIRYFLWLNPDRAGMLFADQALLVEGPSETALINKLRDAGRINLPQGTYVLDCMGKYSLHRFMNLLSELGIPHSVIIDKDPPEKSLQAELNKMILKLSTAEGSTTRCVRFLDPELEGFLGLPVPSKKDSYKKPILLLHSLEKNEIASDKLQAFCALVESCFTGTGQ